MKYLLAAVLFLAAQVQPAVKPLNAEGVATGCNNTTIKCTYTDANVPPGPHFYFVVAQNASGANGAAQYSQPSARVDVVVPTGTHMVTLNWNPSSGNPQPPPSYYIYRGSPATGLTGQPK